MALVSGCGRSPSPVTAVLRFENLTGDPSLDWIGIAASRQLEQQLTRPGNHVFAVDGRTASGRRLEAIRRGASSIVQGYYSVTGGQLRLRADVEDAARIRFDRSAEAAGAVTAGPVTVIDAAAHQLDSDAVKPLTANGTALHQFAMGLDATTASAAREAFAASVQADPRFAPAYFEWAKVELLNRQPDQAMRVLELAKSRQAAIPDSDQARLEADIAALRNDVDARLEALKRLTDVNPSDPAAWLTRAQAETAARQPAEAAAHLRRALDLPVNPAQPYDAASVWNAIGYAESAAGRYEAAVEALERYKKLRPDEPNPLDSLGEVNFALGRFGDAARYFRQAYDANPGFLAGASLLKAAYADLLAGGSDVASKTFAQYREARDKATDPLLTLREANWEYVRGHHEEAARRLEGFADRWEHTPLRDVGSLALSMLAAHRLESGNRRDALVFATRAKQSAASAETARAAAVFEFLAQPSALANEWRDRAGRMFPPNSPDAKLALAYAFLTDGHITEARTAAREAWRGAPPEYAEVTNVLLAWALIEAGDWEAAEAPLRQYPIPPVVRPSPYLVWMYPRTVALMFRLERHRGRGAEAAKQQKLLQTLGYSTDGEKK